MATAVVCFIQKSFGLSDAPPSPEEGRQVHTIRTRCIFTIYFMETFFYFKEQGRRIERGLLPPLRNSGPVQPTRNEKMILFSAVKLKELFKKERKYPWQKPNSCPRCNTCRLWGHGFAAANFDGYQCSLLLKLYRCPDCGCVIRPRSKGYFYRFDFGIWM